MASTGPRRRVDGAALSHPESPTRTSASGASPTLVPGRKECALRRTSVPSASLVVDHKLPSTVGIGEIGIKTLVLYPNPTEGMLNIDFEGEIKSIEVVDMLGRSISLPISISEKTVNGSSLTPGKYMIRITTENEQVLVEEFVVQN